MLVCTDRLHMQYSSYRISATSYNVGNDAALAAAAAAAANVCSGTSLVLSGRQYASKHLPSKTTVRRTCQSMKQCVRNTDVHANTEWPNRK